MPVTLMTAAVGAMLGLADAEMQTILHNPLADPFALGLPSATSFGAAMAITMGIAVIPGVGGLLVTVNAVVFACLASGALYLFARLRGTTREAIILARIAMLFTFKAPLAFLQYGATELELAQLIFWLWGSLARATWPKVGFASMCCPSSSAVPGRVPPSAWAETRRPLSG